ncbi:MAG: hypothetical protein ACR2O6_06570 [Ilumatobacteraceae bacterium]
MHDHDDPEHDLPDAAELEQLARSLSMDGSLGRGDAQRVAAVLRRVAARRRHPTARN